MLWLKGPADGQLDVLVGRFRSADVLTVSKGNKRADQKRMAKRGVRSGAMVVLEQKQNQAR